MEREALMRTIIENPDDDVARLVFADWMEENGEPERAEFIRLQIQLHDIDRGDPLYRVQWRRYWQLVQQCETEWKSQLPALPSGLEWGPFRRGFVDELQLNHGQPYEPFPRVEPNDIPLTRIRCPIQWVDMKLILGEHLQRVHEWDLDFEDQPFRLFINGGPGEQGEFLNEWTRSRTRRSMTRFNLRGGHTPLQNPELVVSPSSGIAQSGEQSNHHVADIESFTNCDTSAQSQFAHRVVRRRLRTLKRLSIASDGNPISGKVLTSFRQYAKENGCEVS